MELTIQQKRLLTCLLALQMPEAGVDENFETASDCWDYYTTMPPETPNPIRETCSAIVNVVGARTSPGMIFEG